MIAHDIVVIGGSAGSLRAIETVTRSLSTELKAAVFIVLHLHSRSDSFLAPILGRQTPLEVRQPCDGDPICPGTIYVPIPDHHLIVARDHVHVSRGPKEGLYRPSINATFRSAAVSHGPSVIGILLSGMLNDGASGLWEIAKHKGIVIVQDPEEAQFPSMPMNAIQDVPLNYTLQAEEIGPLLNDLVLGKKNAPAPDLTSQTSCDPGKFAGFTCPECHGPLRQTRVEPVEFECRVGHVFSLDSLIEQQTSTQERKLYEAVVALEEGADALECAAGKLNEKSRSKLLNEAEQLRSQAASIRKLIEQRSVSSL